VANGTIKRLVRDRGFGFIRDDGGQEWFFHRSAVKTGAFESLNEGQRVSFDEEPSAKGPRAGNIRQATLAYSLNPVWRPHTARVACK
jgi:CspA family cold shock protein